MTPPVGVSRANAREGVDQELPRDETDAGDPQAVQSARDPARLQPPAGTPCGDCGALSQLSSVTHTGLVAGGQRGAHALGRRNRPVTLAASAIDTSSADGGRLVGVSDRQRMEGEHVEVRRVGAGRGALPSAAAGAGRHSSSRRKRTGCMRPTPSGSPLGATPAATTVVAWLDRLHAAVEAVEHFPVEQRREGAPAPFLDDPLGLEIAGEVGLVPCLEQPHSRQRAPGRLRIGERAVVATRERDRERFERGRAGSPAARVGVRPARRGFGEGGRVGDDEQRGQASGDGADTRPRRSARSGTRGWRDRRRRSPAVGSFGDQVAPIDGDAHDGRARFANALQRELADARGSFDEQRALRRRRA